MASWGLPPVLVVVLLYPAMWWIVGLLAVAVVLLFQIAQRLRPIASYFAKRDDEERKKIGGMDTRRWLDWYE